LAGQNQVAKVVMSVDVIVPNYNKQKFIAECLDSLLKQTYTDWRCIVADNFSDDGSWEIIEDFAKKDDRFEIYRIPKPTTSSFYKTWNFGLSKVTNAYFSLLTSDDIWPSNWLEVAVNSLTDNPTAICAAARTTEIDEHSNRIATADFNRLAERFFDNDDRTPQLRDGMVSSVASYFIGPIYTSIHSLVVRSEVLKTGIQFPEDVGSTGDYEWYMRLGFYGDAVYHPGIETGWRTYEGQATKPRSQAENGSFLQTMHLRTREDIANKLGDAGDRFRTMAQRYDREILAYHFARPYLINLRNEPFQEIPKLLKILSTMPKEFILDFVYKAIKKNFYYEESLATAQRFYGKV
jgi:glycosyltransferase involved in cell wall biosynthesis